MVASNTPIYIIGVLDNGTEGMTPVALAHIAAADVVIGARRTLALFANSFAAGAIQHDIAQGLSKVPVWITEAQADDLKAVVLATGDPLCHGIGRYLMNKLGNEQCEVIPNVSTLQLAFARLGLAWQDAVIASATVKMLESGQMKPGRSMVCIHCCRRYKTILLLPCLPALKIPRTVSRACCLMSVWVSYLQCLWQKPC